MTVHNRETELAPIEKLGNFRARRAVILTLLFAAICSSGCTNADKNSRPNILLITLDTTRADHLGMYGYERNTSPELDRLAAESVVYVNAISTASTTLPAHAALFTGKFTSSHGAQASPTGSFSLSQGLRGPKAWQRFRANGIAADQVTLAEHLRNAGYATGAVVAGPWLKRVFGLDRGFSEYDDSEIKTMNGRAAESVTKGALKWVDHTQEISKSKPFFLFLNYFDAHRPYRAAKSDLLRFLSEDAFPIDPSSIEHQRSVYDAEIFAMDREIGRLLDGLRKRQLFSNSWIIVTADHGDLIGEHGKFGHGLSLMQEELAVPLFMKFPKGQRAGETVREYIQHVDVFAIILDALSLSDSAIMQGNPNLGSHPVVAETYPLEILSPNGHWRALFDGDHKFLWNSKGDHHLYDLKNDPSELHDLVASEPARTQEMSTKLLRYLDTLPKPGASGPPVVVDPETEELLRGLGYIP
jgi:arylsulfatase A-like enzyme